MVWGPDVDLSRFNFCGADSWLPHRRGLQPFHHDRPGERRGASAFC